MLKVLRDDRLCSFDSASSGSEQRQCPSRCWVPSSRKMPSSRGSQDDLGLHAEPGMILSFQMYHFYFWFCLCYLRQKCFLFHWYFYLLNIVKCSWFIFKNNILCLVWGTFFFSIVVVYFHLKWPMTCACSHCRRMLETTTTSTTSFNCWKRRARKPTTSGSGGGVLATKGRQISWRWVETSTRQNRLSPKSGLRCPCIQHGLCCRVERCGTCDLQDCPTSA